MNSCKLSNKIFDLSLTYTEFAVYVYLYSIHSNNKNMLGNIIKVKQSTIAQKCNIKAAETVSRVISSLKAKGLINSIIRGYKADGSIGTSSYVINKLDTAEGYFFMDRKVFGEGLSGRELKVYLYILKCISSNIGYMWNSYNDLSKQLKIKRSDVIDIVSKLCSKNLIRKQLVKNRNNKRVYVDNHYFVICYVKHSRIRKKNTKRNGIQLSAINYIPKCLIIRKLICIPDYITEFRKCQYVFLCRGSP